jgi:hypothetical protein
MRRALDETEKRGARRGPSELGGTIGPAIATADEQPTRTVPSTLATHLGSPRFATCRRISGCSYFAKRSA